MSNVFLNMTPKAQVTKANRIEKSIALNYKGVNIKGNNLQRVRVYLQNGNI